jgi:hypothetical protein
MAMVTPIYERPEMVTLLTWQTQANFRTVIAENVLDSKICGPSTFLEKLQFLIVSLPPERKALIFFEYPILNDYPQQGTSPNLGNLKGRVSARQELPVGGLVQ